MTTEEFLALPEAEGVERMLLRGQPFEDARSERNPDTAG
jgi:hypothetical protein